MSESLLTIIGILECRVRDSLGSNVDSWDMLARIVSESIEIVQSFHDGSCVDDTPGWMEIVVEEARAGLLEGSA